MGTLNFSVGMGKGMEPQEQWRSAGFLRMDGRLYVDRLNNSVMQQVLVDRRSPIDLYLPFFLFYEPS